MSREPLHPRTSNWPTRAIRADSCAGMDRLNADCALSDRVFRIAPQPRPSNGMVVALMLMNSTLASSGRLAM